METEKRVQVLVLKVGSEADTSLGTSEAEEARNQTSSYILQRIPSRHIDFDCDTEFPFLTLGTVTEYISAGFFLNYLVNQWIHFLNWSIIA